MRCKFKKQKQECQLFQLLFSYVLLILLMRGWYPPLALHPHPSHMDQRANIVRNETIVSMCYPHTLGRFDK